MASETLPSVLIVGAGPVGLLLALLLSNRSVPVHVIDMADTLDVRPRATHYGSPAVHELERAGVLEDVRRQGFIPRGTTWRKLDGTPLAGLDQSCLPEIDAIHCLPLDRLGQLLLSRLEKNPLARISWGHKVVEVGQDNDKAWVEVETPRGRKRLEALYIAGCDGAKSQVRRSLWGDKSMLGKTWDHQLVATNVTAFHTPGPTI